MLKNLNTQIDTIYKEQVNNLSTLTQDITSSRAEHKKIIDNDENEIVLEKYLADLEKNLVLLRVEVEQSAVQNEKFRITKDERLATDLN